MVITLCTEICLIPYESFAFYISGNWYLKLGLHNDHQEAQNIFNSTRDITDWYIHGSTKDHAEMKSIAIQTLEEFIPGFKINIFHEAFVKARIVVSVQESNCILTKLLWTHALSWILPIYDHTWIR